MPAFPRLVKVCLHHSLGNAIDIGPVPVRLLVLIDQSSPNAFGEFRVTAAIEAQGLFHLEHLGQGQVAGMSNLFPHQMRGQRATLA